MRVKKIIEINGKKVYALFDTGAVYTYICREFTEGLSIVKVPNPYKVAIGGEIIEVKESVIIVGKIEGYDFDTYAIVVDTLGEVDGKKLDCIIGALTMEQWEITPIPKTGELDLTGLKRREFRDFLIEGGRSPV